MRRLSITNMVSTVDWEPYRLLPRALVLQERHISPCDACPGHCCYHPCEISAVEAVRLALTLVLPLESFLELRPWQELGPGYDVQAGHPITLEDGDVRLFLRRVEGGGCGFLHEVDGRGRCVAYAVRPGICRVFPYAFEDEDGARTTIGTMARCPTGWLYDESSERALSGSVAAWYDDLALDEDLCRRWNAEERPERTLSAFARFAVRELAPRLGLDEERLYPPQRRAFGSRVKPS